MTKIPAEKILQSQGFGSRKACRNIIKNGNLEINNQVINDYKKEFEINNLEFKLFGEKWFYKKKVYLAINKPLFTECSRKPKFYKSILDFIPKYLNKRNVQPVGRLDYDTTGLLLITDDGKFNHELTSPKSKISKGYLVNTYEDISIEQINELKNGVKLKNESKLFSAVSCDKVSEKQLNLIINQGKYHQIKRMIVASGNNVKNLQRISIGRLMLKDLKINHGEWCFLENHHLELLM
tara:strand:- start:361 stop:1071 length:711 start_codon:yes stop_codon:yes gene_type:complete